MKRYLILALKTIGVLIALDILIIVILAIVIHTERFQSWMKDRSIAYISETLGTHVALDSVGFNLYNGDLFLYGLEVEDLQKRKMLMMESLEVHADLLSLLSSRVNVSSAEVRGLKANFFKERPDTAANYQFVLDAFKKNHKEDEKEKQKDKKIFDFNLDELRLSDIDMRYNDNLVKLKEFLLSGTAFSSEHIDELPYEQMRLSMKDLETSWTGKTKKGPVRNTVRIEELQSDYPHITIKGIHYKTNNGRPRRNTGRPKRGWFDAGHIDAVGDLDLTLSHHDKDSVSLSLDRGVFRDSIAGFDFRDLRAKVKMIGNQVHLRDIVVQQISTTLKIDTAYIKLPRKAQGDSILYYSTSVINGRTQLRDISRPFAPVLSHFTLPLNLRTRMKGDANGMQFSDVFVFTDDKALTIHAKGNITNLRDKHKLNVHFDVNKMTARGAIKKKIINQFVVKKFMMKQVDLLGTISYIGSFDIPWKRELFRGTLTTAHGNIDFNFMIDNLSKFLTGNIKTRSMRIGKVLDIPEIGEVSVSADFKFDISKQRTAQMRRIKGGKLPIGDIKALIEKASYKFLKFSNISLTVESDGALASGHISTGGKLVDLLCDFTFTNTDEMKKMKIKPGIRLHKNKKSKDKDKKPKDKDKKSKDKDKKSKD